MRAGNIWGMDNVKAVEFFMKAAEGGHAKAQFYLGLCYEKGWGVSQDFQQARYWYQKAAEQGFAEARKNLDNLNKNGR